MKGTSIIFGAVLMLGITLNADTLLLRDGRRVQVNGSLVLTPGDRVDVYCEPADEPALRRIFEGAQS